MNETLLLVLTWLPVVAESGLFVAVARFLAKRLKEHFSLPEKIVKENSELRGEVGKLNKRLSEEIEESKKLKEELEKFSLQLKGINPDEIKKRIKAN